MAISTKFRELVDTVKRIVSKGRRGAYKRQEFESVVLSEIPGRIENRPGSVVLSANHLHYRKYRTQMDRLRRK